MDVFSPSRYPAVGLGDVSTIAAVGGLVGVAVALGVLLAAGLPGLAAMAIATGVLLAAHPHGSVGAVATVLPIAAIVLGVAGTVLVRANKGRAGHAVAGLGLLSGLVAGGLWWSDWEQAQFKLGGDAWISALVAVVAGGVAAFAIARFVNGAVAAGGHGGTVRGTATVGGIAGAALSIWVPFVGYVLFVATAWFLARQRRRAAAKYEGLRILNG